MRNLFFFQLLVVIVSLTFTLDRATFACSCSFLSPCAAYSNAEKVFVGTLEQISEAKESRIYSIKGRFKVEKIYKGKSSSVENVTFVIGSCDKNFKVGEKYFVYVNKSNDLRFCERTNLLSEASADLDYAESLSQDNPKYIVEGDIIGLSPSEVSELKIEVKNNDSQFLITPDKSGFFKFNTPLNKKYQVRIIVPFEANVVANDVFIKNSPAQTVIEYSVEALPNECSYRMLEVSKIEEKKSSIISGKVVDVLGNPVAGIFLYLYPYQANQIFNSPDYKVTKTNNEGEYKLRDVKPGGYIFGINLGVTPAFDTPYPQTFFPGQSNITQAEIIRVAENQNFSLPVFTLKERLNTVKISGKLVWEDGSPITKFSKENGNDQNPLIYLIDPLTYKFFDSFTYKEGRNPVELDDQGNFSFLGYEGYKYIIHAQAFRFGDQAIHAKPIIMKAVNKNPQVILKLFMQGEGKDIDTIEQEMLSH